MERDEKFTRLSAFLMTICPFVCRYCVRYRCCISQLPVHHDHTTSTPIITTTTTTAWYSLLFTRRFTSVMPCYHATHHAIYECPASTAVAVPSSFDARKSRGTAAGRSLTRELRVNSTPVSTHARCFGLARSRGSVAKNWDNYCCMFEYSCLTA